MQDAPQVPIVATGNTWGLKTHLEKAVANTSHENLTGTPSTIELAVMYVCPVIDARRRESEARNHEHGENNGHNSRRDSEHDRSPTGRNPRDTREKMPPTTEPSLDWVGPVAFGSRVRAASMPRRFRTPSHVEKYDAQTDLTLLENRLLNDVLIWH